MITHKILHKYREDIILPYKAITQNVNFILGSKNRVITADNILCDAEFVEVDIHNAGIKSKIDEWYKCSVCDFVNKWVKALNIQETRVFVYMKLTKV